MPTQTSLFTTQSINTSWDPNSVVELTTPENVYLDDGQLLTAHTSLPDSSTLLLSHAIILKGTSFAIPDEATITAIRYHAVDVWGSINDFVQSYAQLIVDDAIVTFFNELTDSAYPSFEPATNVTPWTHAFPTVDQINDPVRFGLMFAFGFFGGATPDLSGQVDQLFLSIDYTLPLRSFPFGVTHERVGYACTHEHVGFGGVTIERPSA